MNIDDKYSQVFKILLLLTSVFAIYWKDLFIVFNEALNSELVTHILAIPFMLSYIIYRLRKVLFVTTSDNHNSNEIYGFIQIKDIFGMILCALGYFLKIYGSYTFYPLEIHIISLPIFLTGLILLIYNTDTMKTLIFPVTFLILLIPPPSTYIQTVGSLLSTISSQISYTITKLLGLPVELIYAYGTPTIILKTISGQEISLAVDLACSGLYSLIGFTIFSLFLAYITREPLEKKGLIVSIGFPLIYSLNILRIIIIVLLAYYFGPNLAMNIFHTFGGWFLIFIGVFVLFSLSEKVFKIKLFRKNIVDCVCDESSTLNVCQQCGRISKSPKRGLSSYEKVKSILLVLVILIGSTIQVPVFVFSDKGAEISSIGSTDESSAYILPHVDDYDLDFSYRDRTFEQLSGQEASLMYKYQPHDKSKPIIWVGLEIAKTKAVLHSWEGCLITWPEFHGEEVRVTKLDLRDIRLIDNPPLTARFFAYYWDSTNEAQVVLYWYTASLFRTAEGFQEKYVKISVIEYPVDPSYYPVAESEIYPIALEVAKFWEPTNEWTNIELLLAENGTKLIMLLLTALSGLAAYLIFLKRAKRKKITTLISYIEDPLECHILEMVSLKERAIITIPFIKNKLKDVLNDDINDTIISEILSQAKKTGLIRRKIVNINDEPYWTWTLL